MATRDELKDPWGWLIAAVSAGVGWAVLAPLGPVAIPVGLGIGAAVLGTKVAVGARGSTGGEPSRARSSQLPKAPRASVQAQLLGRAEGAQRRIRSLAEAPGDEWLSERIGRVDDEAAVVTERLTDLAGRVTVADSSIDSARPQVLADDYARLAASVAAENDATVKQEKQQTLAAVESQVQAVDRLVKLRDRLLSRMQTAVLGLEGLAARMGELVALGADPVSHDRSAEVLTQVTGELETVRSGLEEAEAISRDL